MGDNALDKITVVIADDHMLFREGTRSLLEQEPDMEIVGEASDGEEAVRLVNNLLPQVVLMDIAMSGVNGIEATRRIKAEHSTVAVLVLTAYDNEQYIRALLEAGAAGKSVVGSFSGGVSDAVVNNETGILVPEGDVDATAEAVIKILENDNLAKMFGENGREWARKHDWAKIAKQYLDVYRQFC